MLFKQDVLDRIAAGEVSLAFRRWKGPKVKPGATQLTPVGVLSIDQIEKVAAKSITRRDAKRAGFASASELLKELNSFGEGSIYRIELSYAGVDPRIALREDDDVDAGAFEQIRAKLARLDQFSGHGPWTAKVLKLIEKHPGLRATAMAQKVGRETLRFKADVRKLKSLGLTESLMPGYRLSPRGRAVLRRLVG